MLILAAGAPYFLVSTLTRWNFLGGLSAAMIFYRIKNKRWLLIAAVTPHLISAILRALVFEDARHLLFQKVLHQATWYSIIVGLWYWMLLIVALILLFRHRRAATRQGK